MPSLRSSRDDLEALVALTARNRDLPVAFVEKDFWVVEVLRAAKAASEPLGVTSVFKGGTSLSRVWGIVQRFSEDVDLLIDCEESMTTGQRDRALKGITTAVEDHLGLPTRRETSTKGVKRYTRFLYEGAVNAVITQGVLLEMGVRGGPHPREERQVSSLIAEYAITEGLATASEWAEFTPVRIDVLKAHRTLLEKLSLLHNLAVELPDSEQRLLGAGRHYYDIHQCLTSPDVLNALSGDDVESEAEDIRKHSEAAGFPWTPRPPGGFAESPAFGTDSACYETVVRAYQDATDLFYGEYPTLDECLLAVQRNAHLL